MPRDADELEPVTAPRPGSPSRADAALAGDASTPVMAGAIVRGAGFMVSTGLIALAFAVVLREAPDGVFGRLAVAIAIAAIVQNLGDTATIAVGQRMLVAEAAERRAALQAQLIGTRFVLVPAASVIGILFALVVYDQALTAATAVLCLAALVTSVGAAFTTPLYIELRAARATVAEFSRQVAVAIGLIVAASLSASLLGYAAAYLCASVMSGAIGFWLVERPWRQVRLPSRTTLREVARQASWLAAAITVNALFLKVLTVITSLDTTPRETDLFAASTRVTEVVTALALLVASVAYPVLTHAVEQQDWQRFANAAKRVIEGTLLLAGTAAVVLIVGADPLLAVFAGARYGDAVPILQAQAVAVAFAAMTQATLWALLALHKERQLIIVNLVGLLTLTVAGIVLVHLYGPQGGAYAGILGEATLALGMLWTLKRAHRAAAPSVGGVAAVGCLIALSALGGALLPFPAAVSAILAVSAFCAAAVAVGLAPRELLQLAMPGARDQTGASLAGADD